MSLQELTGEMGQRESARAYNVPVETLRRWVAGIVTLDCRSGPSTLLTSEEEACLAEYCVNDRYGL